MKSLENQVSLKEVNTAKFWVKRELEGNHLPYMPDHVEEVLFLQGRTAWNYKYTGFKFALLKSSKRISFTITASLKKEFQRYLNKHHYTFEVICHYHPENHQLNVTDITKLEK